MIHKSVLTGLTNNNNKKIPLKNQENFETLGVYGPVLPPAGQNVLTECSLNTNNTDQTFKLFKFKQYIKIHCDISLVLYFCTDLSAVFCLF